MNLTLDNNEYSLIKNNRDGFDEKTIVEKYTDYYEPFDYI